MLKIYRKKNPIDSLCPFKIMLNGIELGKIMNGETKDFNLKSGKYKIKIVGGAYYSPEVEIELADDQIIQLICYPAYSDSKLSKFVMKNIFNNEGIYLKVDKDFYL